MLLSILSDLLGKTKYLLTRIRKVFPENTPKDGVPALVALVALFELSLESGRQVQLEFQPFFSTLRQAQLFARNLSTEPLGDILASYVKVKSGNILLPLTSVLLIMFQRVSQGYAQGRG